MEKMKMRTINILMMLLLCLNFTGIAQGQILEKKVSLHYKNITIEEALKDISKKYDVNFSYSNNVVPLGKKITLIVNEKPLNYALKEIFKGTEITFEALGSQVVLKKSEPKTHKSGTKSKNTIEAEKVITNELPIEEPKIEMQQEEAYVSKDTTIYFEEPKLVEELIPLDTVDKSTLRKQYLAEKRKLRNQYYKKVDSLDKTGNKKSKERLKDQFKRVSGKLKNTMNALADSIDHHLYKNDTLKVMNVDTLQTQNKEVLQKDSSEYIYMPGQVTFVTPLGTNGHSSWKTVNNFSFNVLAGGAAGLDGFELGGLVNIEKDYMHGFQLAGLGNVVGDEVKGMQFSGLFNIDGGYSEGVLMSGFMNVVGDNAYGFLGAGFMNVVTGECEGGTFAGFMNVVDGNVDGFQAAGFMNFAGKEVAGGQMAGFLNVAGNNVYGPQIAGFMNIAPDTIRGVQISGFMNVANEVRGSQLGFINFADSVSGAQIGFISFSRKGYRRLELYGSETFYGNVAFKTGTNHFYNIFAAGAQPKGSDFLWGFGYGFGSEIPLSKRLKLNLDLLAYSIHENERIRFDEFNLLSQFRPTLGVVLGKRTSIFAGPVLNVMISDHYNFDTKTYGSPLSPSWDFYNKTFTSNNMNVKAWVGFNAGIRF